MPQRIQRKRTSFRKGDLVMIIPSGTRVYRVAKRISSDHTAMGRPVYVLEPAPDVINGAKRLQDSFRRFAFDELRTVE